MTLENFQKVQWQQMQLLVEQVDYIALFIALSFAVLQYLVEHGVILVPFHSAQN